MELSELARFFTPLRWRERFWARVDKSGGEDACWPWAGNRNKKGYGRLKMPDGSCGAAHRVAVWLSGLVIPLGMLVLHKCDFPPCCNPKHLYVGTGVENAKDREVRGRGNHATGDRHRSRVCPSSVRRGERHSGSRLNEQIVREIRATSTPAASLAVLYGVSSTHIYQIRRRESWAHVL